jgi:hypothetical protein
MARRRSLLPLLLTLTLAGSVTTVTATTGPDVSAATSRLGPVTLPNQAASLAWAGHLWTVTTGAMAGHNTGSARNVYVDARGFLHLRIAKIAGRWRCAELFTQDRLGLGTYQWQVDGRLDRLDAQVVLGLFPYGPAAGLGPDGTNEIDVEYSRWGRAAGPNGDWAVYPASGSTVGRHAYAFALSGAATTSRFTWTGSGIRFALLGGLQPVGTTVPPIAAWAYAPAKPRVTVPQRALPVGMNLWLVDGQAPVDGRSVSVVIRSFTMVPQAPER